MVAIFFCYFLFATGIYVNKLLLATLSPSMLSGMRMLISGLIILFINRKSYREGSMAHVFKNWKTFLAIALFTNFVPAICKAYAFKNMILSKASFIGSIDPFVTALYAYILYSENLTIKKWIGILLGMIGTLLLTTTSSPVEQTLKTFLFFSLPEIAALTSVVVGRLGWILVQKQMRTNAISPVDANGIVMTGGGIFSFLSIPIFYALGSNETLNIVTQFSAKMGMQLLYTIIVGNLIAYNLYAYLLKHNSVTLMSLAGFTIPIHLSIIGYYYGEPISNILLGAGALMLVGVAIFYYDDLMKDIRANKIH